MQPFCKIEKPRALSGEKSLGDWIFTYYVRDAQGNEMATYEETYSGNIANLYMKEHPLYGSSRVGIDKNEIDLIAVTTPPATGSRLLGNKFYELNNHLGNVLVTVTDKKIPVQEGTSGIVDNYLADVASASDYYPGGMLIPERSFSNSNYRFGFNGKENDNEIKGVGNSLDFGARIYDGRLGRWMSIDPKWKLFPHLSNFTFGADNPVFYIDHGGEVITGANKESAGRLEQHFQKVFKGNDALISLFQLQENCMQFQSISQDDFNRATSGLDPKTKILAKGYMDAINSTNTYKFLLIKADEKIDKNGDILNSNSAAFSFLREANGSFANRFGGAVTFANGDEILVLFNEEKVESTTVEVVIDGQTFPSSASEDPDVCIGHEILGEGYLSTTKSTKETIASDFEARNDNNNNNGALKSIQVSNLLRKVLGFEGHRSGNDHNPPVNDDDNDKVQETPIK